MVPYIHILITFLVACHVAPAAAFFRLATSVLVQERVDPVLAPGKASSHAHTIMGGFNFGTTLTYEKLLASKCTSSGVQEDKSAYWTPIVYFWHKNGSFIAPGVEGQGLSVYYKYSVNEATVPFPEGFRMIAGQPLARSWNPPEGAKQYTEFECLGDGVTKRNSFDFPKEICSFSVRMNVYFPRCGDLRTESADGSHVVYQRDGKCPSSHPHLYPELHYELWYSNKEDPDKGIIWADGMDPQQPFVLSNGDPTGYGAHGDFFNGWETETLAKALKTCDGGNGDGRTEICDALTTIDGNKCKKEGHSPDLGNNEKISGWLPTLPGCVPVTNTDAEAVAAPPNDCGNDAPTSPTPAAESSPISVGPSESLKERNSAFNSPVPDPPTTSSSVKPSKVRTPEPLGHQASQSSMPGEPSKSTRGPALNTATADTPLKRPRPLCKRKAVTPVVTITAAAKREFRKRRL